MVLAGEKTQLLVLSQKARDAVGCTIKVSGKTVRAGDSLVLLGIEIDRRLQFGSAHSRQWIRPGGGHWSTLPATAPSHVELIEREMRAAAWIVTGCPHAGGAKEGPRRPPAGPCQGVAAVRPPARDSKYLCLVSLYLRASIGQSLLEGPAWTASSELRILVWKGHGLVGPWARVRSGGR